MCRRTRAKSNVSHPACPATDHRANAGMERARRKQKNPINGEPPINTHTKELGGPGALRIESKRCLHSTGVDPNGPPNSTHANN